MGEEEQVQREMSFGEKAVGLTFNPSSDPQVQTYKTLYAEIIDGLAVMKRKSAPGSELERMCWIAIKEAQTAQMWAVKAITWKD